MGFFRGIKRVFIWLGLMAEKATETDAINQAVVERGIRDSKVKADKAHYANGQLAGQVAMLKEQLRRQERQRDELQGLVQAAIAANDEAKGHITLNSLLSWSRTWKTTRGSCRAWRSSTSRTPKLSHRAFAKFKNFKEILSR